MKKQVLSALAFCSALGIARLSLKIWGVRLKTLILRHEAKRENPR